MRVPVLTLVALALATPAAAQMAYRNTFPDGRVVYSDQPLPGAAVERPTAPPPPSTDPSLPAPAVTAPVADPAPAAAAVPVADPAPAAAAAPVEAVPGARWPPPPDARPMTVAAPATVPEPAPAPVAAAQPAPERISAPGVADQDVRAAQHYLAAAQATLEAGREPLPGERTGLAHGGSRLNELYWTRQRQLETAVADAQTRLAQAVAAKRF